MMDYIISIVSISFPAAGTSSEKCDQPKKQYISDTFTILERGIQLFILTSDLIEEAKGYARLKDAQQAVITIKNYIKDRYNTEVELLIEERPLMIEEDLNE